MIRPRPALIVVLAAAMLASGCASTSRTAAPAPRAQGRADAMVSGDDGLGISGPITPAALQDIVAAPYAVPSPPDCAAMARDIAALDEILGPDVDAVAAARSGAGDALGTAMRGAIPYRWVMRLMTQAGRRDRDLRLAVLAGAARRAYLKGLRRGLGCQPPQAPPL